MILHSALSSAARLAQSSAAPASSSVKDFDARSSAVRVPSCRFDRPSGAIAASKILTFAGRAREKMIRRTPGGATWTGRSSCSGDTTSARSNTPGSTLLRHLQGVAQLLRVWGCRQAVIDAGLLHSAYGTETFEPALVSSQDRPMIAGQLGAEAEALAFLFCRMNRASLYENLERPWDLHLVLRDGQRAALTETIRRICWPSPPRTSSSSSPGGRGKRACSWPPSANPGPFWAGPADSPNACRRGPARRFGQRTPCHFSPMPG